MAMLGKLRRRRFGEILVGDGLIDHDQLAEALELQRSSGDTLGSVLLDLGYIVETDILKALSIQYQLPCLRPQNYDIDKKLIEDFDPIFLHSQLLVPFDKFGSLMLILMHDIPTKPVLQELQKATKHDLAIYLGTSNDIKACLNDACPISAQEEENIRLARKRSRAGAAAQQESDGVESEEMDLSSENLLSSLDAAWDSIFVESSESSEGG